MTGTLQAVILNYCVGPKTQKPKDYILRFPSVKNSDEASRLIGKKVAWPIGQRKIIGKIVDVHGRKGLVRARFRKGLPGQALGTLVEIVG